MFAAIVKANKANLAATSTTVGSSSSNDNLVDSLLQNTNSNVNSTNNNKSAFNNNNNSSSIPLSPELSHAFQILEWDPEIYGVGVRSIDEQHQQLIGTMAKLCILGKQVATSRNPSSSSFPGSSSPNSTSSSNNKRGSSSPTKQQQSQSSSLAMDSPSSSIALGNQVTSPMTLKGALGLDSKKYGTGENQNGEESSSAAASYNNNKTRKSVVSIRDGEDEATMTTNKNADADYNNIASSVHVYGHRVTLPEAGFRTIDRGHPPDLQKGGRIEPILESLVMHCSVRLIQEEHSLEAVSFSDRGPHALEHQIFVREVFRAYQLMEQYNLEMSDLVKLIKFLKTWVKDHIPKDRRFAPLLLDKQSSLAAGRV